MKILMLTESNYPLDLRIKQEAELLIDHGHLVSVIAIKDNNQPFKENINDVHVYRVPKLELFPKTDRNPSNTSFRKFIAFSKSLLGYSIEYCYFTLFSFVLSFLLILNNRFDAVHTHNPPDTLFIVACFHKFLFRSKFIYDHHDLSPDLFFEKYPHKPVFIYKTLLFFERVSCKFADFVIATNESYKNVEIDRCGINENKIYIVRNGPNLDIVKPSAPIELDILKGKIVLCYIGVINIQDGVQYLLEVAKSLVYEYNFKNFIFMIIGDGDYLSQLKHISKEYDIEEFVLFTGFIRERELINRYLSSADFFIDAAPFSFLNDNSTFIKHMEYMVFGKPVFSFSLKESMYSLSDAGIFISPNDTNQMARKIIEVSKDDKLQKILRNNALKRIKDLSWDKVSAPLLDLYKKVDSITQKRGVL